MSSSRSARIKNLDPDQYMEFSPEYSKSRKRSASLQSVPLSDSDAADKVYLETVTTAAKRLKKASRPDLASPEFNALSPVSVTDVEDIQNGPLDDDYHVIEDSSVFREPSPPIKRVRRPTEKSLYNSRESPRKVKEDKQALAKTIPPTSTTKETSRAPVVKAEPIDTSEALWSSPYSGSKVKGKQLDRFSVPIVVSSEEEEPLTPMRKTVKRCDVPGTKSSPQYACPDEDPGETSAELPASILPSPRKPIRKVPAIESHGTIEKTSPRKPQDPVAGIVEKFSPRKSKDPAVDAQGTVEKSSMNADPSTSTSSSTKEVYLEDLVAPTEKTSFMLVPFDSANGITSCPHHLLHTNDDGTSSPLELVAGAFTLFEGAAFKSISSAIHFKELRPFVNVTSVPREQIYAERYKHHVMWQGQNRSVLFTMLGSVQSCRLIEPTTIGQHLCRAITIIPFGEAWRRFQTFLGKLYGQGHMRGPFEYGCLLTLSGRREGYSMPDVSNMLGPATPKKNKRAFGGSGVAATAEWYDSKLPNCVDFDKPVPIYDASETPFLFRRQDFINMPSLPLYKKHDKLSDLPVDSVVSVFFAMSSYSAKRSMGATSGSASFKDVLSLNIHYVIYYGTIHDD